MTAWGCAADGDLNVSKFSEPMPWIGMYIVAASAVCLLFMAIDVVHGFRYRKLWFPCKFFALNSMTLTLIGVAVKLSVDLNTSMPRVQDQLAKLSSNAFLCVVIANSMPSLGAMETKDLMMNVIALGILIVTVIVNVGIQLGTGVIYELPIENTALLFLMVVLLAISISSGIAIPATKRYLDRNYEMKYQLANEECGKNCNSNIPRKLREDLMRYWMMAHTCNPQFVVGRLATCTASGAFCLLSAGVLAEAMLRTYLTPWSFRFCSGDSDYKWSVKLILITQAVAVGVGSIAPAFRWFLAIKFRCPSTKDVSVSDSKSGLTEVEQYWVEVLYRSRQWPLELRIGGKSCRKFVHNMKHAIFHLCIMYQKGIVISSKIVRQISILFMSHTCERLMQFIRSRSLSNIGPSPSGSWKLDLSHYVLHLEGEVHMIDLMKECQRDPTKHWIKLGMKKQPENLIQLLKKMKPSSGFEGVKRFDSKQVPSLNSREPPNSWALPVVTLTSIAIATCGHDSDEVNKLLQGVHEALRYIRVVENTIESKENLGNVRKAAEVLWVGIDLHHRWLDVDLRSFKGQKHKETIIKLSVMAENKFAKAKEHDMYGCLRGDSSKWPIPALAANSMYRACQTLLLFDLNEHTNGVLEKLTDIIMDIVGACFMNIPRSISMRSHQSSIESREESVRHAFLLLGETQRVMEILSCQHSPVSEPEKMACINAWRSLTMEEGQLSNSPVRSDEFHLDIDRRS